MATKEPNTMDFVQHGSARHAMLLGLKKAGKDDALQLDGWTLLDITAYGPAATEVFLRETLRQKVAELTAGSPPIPQSEDPTKPHYRPAMWVPVDEPLG